MRAIHVLTVSAFSVAVGLTSATSPRAQTASGGSALLVPTPGSGEYPGKRPRPYPRLVGPETLNPGAWPERWPYPDQYNSIAAAPEVHHLRYVDDKVNFVEVAYFAGVHGQMHGHPYPSVFAIDAPTPRSINERLDPDRRPQTSHADAPDGMQWPVCNTMGPESPHAETNLDTWPHHFYRIEFKRVDGAEIQKNWKAWYPRMLDAPLLRGGTTTGAKARRVSNGQPYTTAHDSVIAAPNNYKLLWEDSKVRLIEVTLRPGESEPMHGDPYPAVIAMDAISDVTTTDRLSNTKSALNGRGDKRAGPPPGFASPSCATAGARAPHALTNLGATPLHYYRIEFKRIDGDALKDNWRNWYPWMSDLADQTEKNPTRPNY